MVKANLINAAAYPVFVLSVGLLSMVVILVWVLPRLIATIGVSVDMLPLPTRMLMGLSHFLIRWGWACVIALFVGGSRFGK
jgi:type II secretory pathway component PulF